MNEEDLKPEDIKISVYRKNRRTNCTISFNLDTDGNKKWGRTSKDIKHYLERNKWLIPHLYSWQPWAHEFNTDVFCEGLYQLGKHMVEHGHGMSSEKHGRRAMFGARRLQNLVKKDELSYIIDDKSYQNWSNRHDMEFNPTRIGRRKAYQMGRVYTHDNAMNLPREEYSSKMYKVITNRLKPLYAKNLKEAWDYVIKYIRYWWD